MQYEQKYAKYKQSIEEYLKFPELENKLLSEPILYSINAGGKRVRPVLTLAFCEAYGGDVNKAVPVAAAIEILHTSTLIQDDLPCMDDDDLRRGKPACHKAFSESAAILAASAMSYFALGKIAETNLPNVSAIISEICRFMGVCGVYGGQDLDLTFENNKNLSLEDILKMYDMKTCALLKAACVSGCFCAGAGLGSSSVNTALEYAYNLGIAFQLTDDILDETSTSEILGKLTKSDEKNQKSTYVSIAGLEQTKKDAEFYTQKALSALNNIPQNEFLTELTKELLNRKN